MEWGWGVTSFFEYSSPHGTHNPKILPKTMQRHIANRSAARHSCQEVFGWVLDGFRRLRGSKKEQFNWLQLYRYPLAKFYTKIRKKIRGFSCVLGLWRDCICFIIIDCGGRRNWRDRVCCVINAQQTRSCLVCDFLDSIQDRICCEGHYIADTTVPAL